jgi:formate dehydrogenase alpha subunit
MGQGETEKQVGASMSGTVKSGTVKLMFNGQEIEVPEGTYLIEAAKQAGAEIPHFCYHPKLRYDANCRMCIVEVEKAPKLQTSCSTVAGNGMVVWSNTPRVKEAQEGVMAFLLGNHPLDCPECDQGGECQLQDFAHAHAPRVGRFTEKKRVFTKEYFGPLIEKEMNRCVSCLRCVRYCDEVLDVNALGSMDRGSLTQIGGFNHHPLDCEFCGGCIQICPVGALTSRVSMYDYRPWQVKKTETVCNYCGDGCAMTLETMDDKVVRVSSKLGHGRNEGDLCARGFFGYGYIHHDARLTRPILQSPGGGRAPLQVTWEAALQRVVTGIEAVKAQYGPQAIGGLISARCANEELDLFQKLMREVIGTPHLDSSARYGHINAVTALREVFGTHRLARYEEVVQADVLLVFGGDMTETNPIAALKVKEAVRKGGARLISVAATSAQSDTYRSHLPRLAEHHLQIRLGTEREAILGLTKALTEALAAATPFSQRIAAMLAGLSYAQIEAATGVAEASFRAAAALYAGAERGVLIFGRSITGSVGGYQNVLNLGDLAILAGQVGRPGTGILALTEENNEQGAVEMGCVPEYLPGFVPVTEKGYTLVEMLDAAARGEIKALYLVGENPLRSLPQKNLEAALKSLDLLVCQDLFLSETAALAHVVLPACSYAEKEGRFTNQEGEVQKFRQAIQPVGNARPDGEIFSMLAKKMGASWPDHNMEDVFRARTLAMPRGWPAVPQDAIHTAMAAHCARPVDSARYTLTACEANLQANLQVGQLLFHSGRMSTYASGLSTLVSKEALLMHPDDAQKAGIEEGEIVEVAQNGSGSVALPVQFSRKRAPGTLFFPEHFNNALKRMLPLTLDPVTRVPYGDRGQVTLSRQRLHLPSPAAGGAWEGS